MGMNHLVKVEAQMLSNMDDVSGIVSKEQISKAISILEAGIEKYKYTEDKQILLEITLYKISDSFNEKSSIAVVDNLNQVRGTAPIDYNVIEKMMEDKFGTLLASVKPINVQNQNISTNSVIAQEPQVQQNQEIRVDTVNSTYNTASNIQCNGNVGQQMLDYLKANWEQFLRILQGNNYSIATVIAMSKPISFEKNTLVIEFPSNSEFYCEMFNGQMISETSVILSKCMNVKCSVIATVVAETKVDTVDSTYNKTASEIQNEPIMPQFSTNNFIDSKVEEKKEENQFNVQNAGVTEFHIEQPQVQQPTNQTQSFFGQPTINVVQEESKVVEVEEKKVSKEDQVDMNMLENMFV
jgi:hypothetical protein